MEKTGKKRDVFSKRGLEGSIWSVCQEEMAVEVSDGINKGGVKKGGQEWNAVFA